MTADDFRLMTTDEHRLPLMSTACLLRYVPTHSTGRRSPAHCMRPAWADATPRPSKCYVKGCSGYRRSSSWYSKRLMTTDDH